MSDQSAFRSNAAEVLEAWQQYVDRVDDVRARRDAMSDRYGRRLMVNRLGFGHGTRVVGFERFDDDNAGDVIGEGGELRVPKNGYGATVEPNLRRKAGKDLADELASLKQDGPGMPGMPSFVLSGNRALSPALFRHEDAIYALWSGEIGDNRTGGELALDTWERIPLSAFYAADEARKAVGEATR